MGAPGGGNQPKGMSLAQASMLCSACLPAPVLPHCHACTAALPAIVGTFPTVSNLPFACLVLHVLPGTALYCRS